VVHARCHAGLMPAAAADLAGLDTGGRSRRLADREQRGPHPRFARATASVYAAGQPVPEPV
jgi:hypothetical protein